MKQARKLSYIPFMVTGEYGEKNKRPHWHAIIFNYSPPDKKHKYTTDLDEKVYDSEEISKLWGKGNIEFGSVTMESAGYVARYAAKKLVHGKDQDHNYQPIHKTSSRHAIGKTWLEKYWKQTFEQGKINLPNGTSMKIPRYYKEWLKKEKPLEYVKYKLNVEKTLIKEAEKATRKEELEHISEIINKSFGTFESRKLRPKKRSKIKLQILERKFEKLQENLKL